MNYVGKQFPDINIPAINDFGDVFQLNILRKAKEEKKKILLFWYPKDFTFVCPTELHALQEALPEFEKRNTIVVGASCDTPEVHFAWLNTKKDDGGIEGITFDLLADSNRNLANILGILDVSQTDKEVENVQLVDGDNVTYRASYLIDEEGVVFHAGINHMPLGRNVHEFLRIVDAYRHFQVKGEVCPANWEDGKEAMSATREGVSTYLSQN